MHITRTNVIIHNNCGVIRAIMPGGNKSKEHKNMVDGNYRQIRRECINLFQVYFPHLYLSQFKIEYVTEPKPHKHTFRKTHTLLFVFFCRHQLGNFQVTISNTRQQTKASFLHCKILPHNYKNTFLWKLPWTITFLNYLRQSVFWYYIFWTLY